MQNRISLNVKKTDMTTFKSKLKKYKEDKNIKLCAKTLYPTKSLK